MTADRSLDEFVEPVEEDSPDDAETGQPPPDASRDHPGGSAADEQPTGEPDGPATDGDTAEPVTGAAAEPPPPLASTYVWSPGGEPCAACGETVEARWRDGDQLVCPDCKDW